MSVILIKKGQERVIPVALAGACNPPSLTFVACCTLAMFWEL